MAADKTSLGTILSVTGTALLATYVEGAIFYASSASLLLIDVAFATDGATTLTTATFRLQGSINGTKFHDVPTVRSDTGTEAIEHTVAAPTAGNTSPFLFRANPALFVGGMKLAVKVAGGSKANDQVAVAGNAW